MRSKFYEDKRLEELFGSWLDSHLYPSFPVEGLSGFQRVNDENYQKKGIDTIVQAKGNKLLIDEKATLHYINKNIPTFAFELLNRTSGAQGWLYNQSYLTTHYLLAWPNATNPDSILESGDYSNADVMLIERASLIDMLAKKRLDKTALKEKVDYYLPKVTRQSFKFELVPGITLFFTEWLAEKPINIVIKKNLLDTIAIFHKRIY